MYVIRGRGTKNLILSQEPTQLFTTGKKRVFWYDTEIIVVEDNKLKNLQMIIRGKVWIEIWRQRPNVWKLGRYYCYRLLNVERQLRSSSLG